MKNNAIWSTVDPENGRLLLLTLGAILCSWLCLQLFPYGEWVVFGIGMAVSGIPHGAMDEVLSKQRYQAKGKNFHRRRFITYYWLKGSAFALIWWLAPTLAFLLFLLLSAYHFGQSQLYAYFPEKHWSAALSYIAWGTGLLLWLLLPSWDTIQNYLIGFLDRSVLQWIGNNATFLLVIAGLLISLPLIERWINNTLTTGKVLMEIALAVLLLWSSYLMGGIVAFILYFCIWHAGKSIALFCRVRRLERPHYTLITFYKEVFWYATISLIGLIVLLVISTWVLFSNWHLLFLFFVMISVLTLPHAISVEKIFNMVKKHK
ncbi:Brp/Blh family beta-carotene 15,15'-dioxygenase [Algivirga pacifica]|uniref:Brp/Blh family beta-carotene 15,15'-dioxygenase n=1 Tax=Algivirga pacifica TaxID=1162670 RepID=A0ABP9D305_9BACT